jgi:hypothetical protein
MLDILRQEQSYSGILFNNNNIKGHPLVFGDRELQCIFSKGISPKRHQQIQCGFLQTKDNK